MCSTLYFDKSLNWFGFCKETPGRPTSARSYRGEKQSMAPKQILIVDNDPVILALLNKFLTREGHVVRTVQDGATALNLLDTWVPDIFFIDMVMPGMSGDRLCRLIRETSPAAQSYICIITALSEN